ncbi:TIGR02453 family protein [Methylocaldum sp. GT1TLB]|jgi:uncharacterized protein (TIGR02453 family)|uniref:TIGR02453 family protein n=1 Tax=Methylocaldum sp. GT1TLB TaxID=3438965 RepID=UPI003DA080C6
MTKNRFVGFPEDLFRFLEELSMNNNREWFTANKRRYQTSVVAPVSDFIQAMGERLNRISPHFTADPRPNGGSMFRIYRDTRFSHDKRPYKENVGCHFRHVTGKSAHALGFYLHLQPGAPKFDTCLAILAVPDVGSPCDSGGYTWRIAESAVQV